MNNYFNVNAFKENPTGTFGDTGKGIMRGPSYNNTDVSLSKNWKILERYHLQFRWEMFNALNHPNFANPNSNNQIDSNSDSATKFGWLKALNISHRNCSGLRSSIQFLLRLTSP